MKLFFPILYPYKGPLNVGITFVLNFFFRLFHLEHISNSLSHVESCRGKVLLFSTETDAENTDIVLI